MEGLELTKVFPTELGSGLGETFPIVPIEDLKQLRELFRLAQVAARAAQYRNLAYQTFLDELGVSHPEWPKEFGVDMKTGRVIPGP